MILRIVLFLILNFGALAVGSIFTSDGVVSEWYQQLDKAPWTPPGWMFGFAWTMIMICFAIYLAYLYPLLQQQKRFVQLYIIQWILNVLWNPVFFYFQNVWLGLMIISALTCLMGYYLVSYKEKLAFRSLFVLPYFFWLLIATSLNAYILLFN